MSPCPHCGKTPPEHHYACVARHRTSLPHTIAAAIGLGELDEEEAYFILRFAGRMGYDRAIQQLVPWPRRIRQWLVHPQGWEPPELLVWDLGYPAWTLRDMRGRLKDPLPLSMFGTRLCLNGHLSMSDGIWLTVRIGGGYLVLQPKKHRIYWSPDATPSHARAVFYVGSPRT